jgi:uncharacterized protein YkwD
MALLSALVIAALTGAPRDPVLAQPAEPGCVVPEADLSLDTVERALGDHINAYRAELGLSTLTHSPALTRAAVWKSHARAAGGPEQHDDPGRRWDVRLSDCGYDLAAAKGENLARISGPIPSEIEAAEVVAAWKASPRHDAVLREPAYQVVGIGRVRVADTSYWSADFGGADERRQTGGDARGAPTPAASPRADTDRPACDSDALSAETCAAAAPPG